MALCTATLLGATLSCTSNFGGLQNVYLASADAVPTTGITFDTDMEITGFTASAGTFKQYAFERVDSSDATLNITDTVVMNKRLDLQKVELVLKLNKIGKALRKEMEALKNKDLVALVKDENDVWMFLGYSQPLRKSARTVTTGASRAAGDNGYSITFMCEEKSDPYTVKASAALAVI